MLVQTETEVAYRRESVRQTMRAVRAAQRERRGGTEPGQGRPSPAWHPSAAWRALRQALPAE